MKQLTENTMAALNNSYGMVYVQNGVNDIEELKKEDVTFRLLDLIFKKAPDLFNEKYFMDGFSNIINGKPVLCKTMALKTEYSLSYVQNLKEEFKDDAEQILMNEVSDKIIDEFMSYKEKFLDPNKEFCWLVPLQMIRAVRPDSYEPVIGFKTMFGVIEV